MCLGPLDKPVFDERFATPTVDRQFIEGPKKQKSRGVVSALEHIVRSAQKHGTESRIYKTPQATAASPNTSLPYPIGTGAFYTTGERLSRRGEEATTRRWSAGRASSSTHTQGTSWTRHSSGTPSHLRNPVNLPDEGTVGVVNPLLVSEAPPSLETPALPLAGGSSQATPEKK